MVLLRAAALAAMLLPLCLSAASAANEPAAHGTTAAGSAAQGAPAAGSPAQGNDLREFRIGMPVSALPPHGYVDFTCANHPATKIAGWADWRSCPVDTHGYHAVGFRYEDALGDGGAGKTQVDGQPATLALLIDDQATVAGLRISTDPHSPLYLHKKAFLFALQVRGRFGEDGWTCKQTPPTPTEQPIGHVFFHDHCEKTTSTRHLILDRELFHDPAQDLRNFTSETQLVIERPS